MTDTQHDALLTNAENHQAQLTAILIMLKEIVEQVRKEMVRARGIVAMLREDGEPQ